MKNLLKKQITTNTKIKTNLSIFELNLIRESLMHSIRTSDWGLDYDLEAKQLLTIIDETLSKYKIDATE